MLQRCGFAYGAMPAASVPTIAITATDVTFNGKVVDHPSNVLADSSSSWKIAGADDVVYGDVVKTIELATKVGFTDWKVLPPAGLAVRPER